MNPRVNHGLGVIMMCQSRFILGKKCTPLVSDADNGEAMCVGGQGMYVGNLYTFLSILL